jgi:hypothetical protein
MWTLADYQKLDKDLVVQGIYDWAMQAESGFLAKVPIKEVAGNGIKYNVKTVPASISFQDPMDDIPETTATMVQRSASIYVAIVDCYLSKFARATNSTQDPDVVELKSKTEDFMKAIYSKMVLGQTTTGGDIKQPKGMLKLLAELESESATDLDSVNNSQVIAQSAASGSLDLAGLEKLLDAVKDGANFLMMSRIVRRKVNALSRASGSPLRVEQDGFGRFIQMYNDVPIFINDFIPDNIQDGAGSVVNIAAADISHAYADGFNNSIILAGKINSDSGFCINQAAPLTKEYIGRAQKKDAEIHRIKWYHGYAVYSKYSLAGLINIDTAG